MWVVSCLEFLFWFLFLFGVMTLVVGVWEASMCRNSVKKKFHCFINMHYTTPCTYSSWNPPKERQKFHEIIKRLDNTQLKRSNSVQSCLKEFTLIREFTQKII